MNDVEIELVEIKYLKKFKCILFYLISIIFLFFFLAPAQLQVEKVVNKKRLENSVMKK